MSDELKILSMDEIESKSPTTKIITVPDMSAEIGEPVRAKISKISPEDLLGLYDFPMEEINSIVATSEDSESEINKMANEQWQAFDLAEKLKMIRSLITKSLIEPAPAEKFIARLSMKDLNFVGEEILELSSPSGETAGAARFPDDGKRGSD